MMYLVIVILINAATFFLVSRGRKGVINEGIRQTKRGETTTYLICDVFSRSSMPFKWLLGENSPIKGGIHIVDYQNFGFNPEVAAHQIGYDIYNRSRTAILVAVSLGAEIPRHLQSQFRTIVIDPVYGRQSLARLNKKIEHYMFVVLEAVVILLGWLSFLPIVRCGNRRFSLALIVDWFYWATSDPGITDEVTLDGLIVSTEDELADRSWAIEHIKTYDESCTRYVPCGRADFDDFGAVYASDLATILQRVANGFRSYGSFGWRARV